MNTTPWARDLFFQYPTTGYPTSRGVVQLPIFYYRASMLMSMFRVDLALARKLMTDADLDVIPLGSRHALALIAFFEYRETAIGDYNEAGLALLVRPKVARAPAWPLLAQMLPLDQRESGIGIVDLPVTTEAACSAGREVWGLPKFVTGIGFSLQGRQFRGEVSDPEGGQAILQLSGGTGAFLPGPLLDYVLYSRHEGQLLRTLVNTRGGARLGTGGGLRVKVSEGSAHPMAQRLRALGLQGASPFLTTVGQSMQARLNAGAQVPV